MQQIELKNPEPSIQEHDDALTPPRTPTAATTAAYQLFAQIQSIHEELIELPSLAPNTKINALLTQLVGMCIQPCSTECLTELFHIKNMSKLCGSLRSICATAEGELERYWATRIVEATKVSDRPAPDHLHTFPYYQNYIDLSRLECCTLEAFLPSPPKHVAFIGSGPLPLTSLCMLDRYPDARVHNIDRDVSALQISRELCERLGYGMTFSCEDVSVDGNGSGTVESGSSMWQTFDVVFLAALVGMDAASKLAILSSMVQRVRPGTLVVARSAQGLRSVLYPIFDLLEGLESIGLEVLVEVHPWTKVVNSVVVMRVKG